MSQQHVDTSFDIYMLARGTAHSGDADRPVSMCRCALRLDSSDPYTACSVTLRGIPDLGRYQDKQNQLHKAVQDMYPPGACIFLRRLKAKIVRKERKKAEREARKREKVERRDIERQDKHERKVRQSLAPLPDLRRLL